MKIKLYMKVQMEPLSMSFCRCASGLQINELQSFCQLNVRNNIKKDLENKYEHQQVFDAVFENDKNSTTNFWIGS